MQVMPTDEAARRRYGGPLPGLMAVFATLLRWDQTARERRSLRELDDRALRDLGLTRADVEREALRPFWDLPPGQRSACSAEAGCQCPAGAFPVKAAGRSRTP